MRKIKLNCNRKALTLPAVLLAASALLNPFHSFGQNISADREGLMHQERVSDPYLPNEWNNKKTSPAYKYTNIFEKGINNSTISTTQVNVNGSGQNILGDAANETSIAIHPLNANIMAIGWRQFDNVSSSFRQAGWGYTTNGGLTWTFPGSIMPGTFRTDPVLDFDTAGNFYYNSLTSVPDFFCKVFKSTNGGASWGIGTDAGGGDKQWMVIDRTAGAGSGNIYSSWTSTYSTCLPGFFTRSTDGNASYETCTVVDGDPFWATMAVGVNGELFIGGASMTGPVVAKSLDAQIPSAAVTWQTPSPVFLDGALGYGPSVNPDGLLGQASIDVDLSAGAAQGNVYLLASVERFSNGDPADVMFARSTDGGSSWSSPVRVNDDISVINTQWFGTMSVAPNGRIDAIWLDTRDNPGSELSALYYSYSTDQGNTWSANEMLSAVFDPHLGFPNQNKMGDYFDMISHNSGAHLAWANTLNGEQDVYYSHIIPPVVGIHNNVNPGSAAVSVFPNPTSSELFIVSAAAQSRIDIYSMLGEKTFSMTTGKTKTEIDISFLPSGIYLLEINSNDRKVARKVIKL